MSFSLNARDTKTLRRIIDKYGHIAVMRAMADNFDVNAAIMQERGDVVGQRWNSRAALAMRRAALTTTYGINGRVESQPEFDNIILVG